MDESIKVFVNETVAKSKIVVFSKTNCPYCKKVKAILSIFPIKDGLLEIIELNERPDGSNIQDYLKELTGARSVPRVFINGKFVGGCDDTVALDSKGELQKLLADCEAIPQGWIRSVDPSITAAIKELDDNPACPWEPRRKAN